MVDWMIVHRVFAPKDIERWRALVVEGASSCISHLAHESLMICVVHAAQSITPPIQALRGIISQNILTPLLQTRHS